MTGTVLHNGIALAASWPPVYGPVRQTPMPVPWLATPPACIPIDTGRQLFVDDFLIERMSLTRVFHQPAPHPANPLLAPETDWERGDVPFAMPFSDGVWFDPADDKFKLWYAGNEMWCTCYAESEDGLNWVRPDLGVVAGTNVTLNVPRDSSTVWLDHGATDPLQRFKMVQTVKDRLSMREPLRGRGEDDFFTYTLFASPDGKHWQQIAESPPDQPIGDRSTVYFDAFRKVWIYSIRDIEWQLGRPGGQQHRVRLYCEHPDLAEGLADLVSRTVPWTGADDLDPPHPNHPDQPPQLYNLDATPYESLMVAFYSIHQGPENEICEETRTHKRNQIALGFSRDGFHWHRPDRRPFIGARSDDPAAWDWGNIQSVGGGFLVVGDELWIYYSGRALDAPFWDGGGGTGLAVLRRDGFASVGAGPDGGILLTRPLRCAGAYLFVNLAAPRGRLRVAALDEDGAEIAGFGLADCKPVGGDATHRAVSWRGHDSLAPLVGRPIRLRFELFDGALYSFWVSRHTTGESGGFTAAGGPGIVKGVDEPRTDTNLSRERQSRQP